jgi:L-malate glycosyltransferase
LLSRILSRQSHPLKILHIASGDLWAGAEVQLYNLLCALRDNDGVTVAAALLNDGELAQRLREQGIEVHVFPESALGGLAILRGLRGLLRTWRPDIVHTHRHKENILGSLANLCAGRAPCVRTVHGAPESAPRGLLRRLPAALDRWCGRHLQQRSIAVTRELADKLAAHQPRARIAVIENGIDPMAVAAAAQAEPGLFAQGRTHIGIAGRLARVKRVDLFLEMAALLRQREPEGPRRWQFHIFGDGPLRAELERQAQSLGLGGHVVFHGHRIDIAACIRGLDILVMCSDHEGLPMILLEAMSIGTTIVGNSTGGITELLDGGRNGWPVTDHSAPGYTHAILDALRDPETRRERAHSAAANVLTQYSAATCATRHLSLYRDLLPQRGAARE